MLIWILTAIAVFSMVLVWAGRRYSLTIHSVEGFFLANRQLAWGAVAISFVASWFGASSTIATLNAVYERGLNGVWDLVIPSVLSCLCITLFIARRVAETKTASLPEAMEQAYGQQARVFMACVVVIASTNFVASQLVAAGLLFNTLLHIALPYTIGGVAILVFTYTWLGGYRAVVFTDRLQMVAIIIGLLVLLSVAVQHYQEVLYSAKTDPTAVQWEHVRRAWPDWQQLLPKAPSQWGMVVTFVLGWVIAPEMWQRMASLKEPEKATQTAAFATIAILALLALVVIIGMLSRAFVVDISPESGAVLMALVGLLPKALAAVVVVAVLSAIASTMDSSLNVGSMALSCDILAPLFSRLQCTMLPVRLSRWSTGLMLLSAVAIALYFQDIIRILWISADIYAACMLIPVLGFLYAREFKALTGRLIPSMAGELAILSGLMMVSISFVGQFQPDILPGFWPQWPWTTLMGVGISGLVYGVVVFLWPFYLKNGVKG